ncbi:hypothetical protein N2603_05255 [Bradyrhizobium huanghuaihaiense]|uniref:hypothetical protein n=1 Tax=Bradyrhizobium huanghuaihaiense TaxID=990078 RepID=UPI0021AA02A7|nr:hypothetical protein [Bradyrhizobium sp. CB3035]UWU77876.1 hypothetical protein N2603_05255 [Bradyrhizobium sp. CB3035]
MQVKIMGVERRRRGSYDEKVRLVEETVQAGETVCGVTFLAQVGMCQTGQKLPFTSSQLVVFPGAHPAILQ